MVPSGFISLLCCILVVVFFAGIVYGEETPALAVIFQSNTSSVIEDQNGTFVLHLQQVEPNATVSDQKNKTPASVPIMQIIKGDTLQAALVLTKEDGEKSITMVHASMPIYDIQNETLRYKIQPLEFYDGVILSSYQENQTEIIPGDYGSSRLILEDTVTAAENGDWWHMLPPGECRKNAQVMWQCECYQQVDGQWELHTWQECVPGEYSPDPCMSGVCDCIEWNSCSIVEAYP